MRRSIPLLAAVLLTIASSITPSLASATLLYHYRGMNVPAAAVKQPAPTPVPIRGCLPRVTGKVQTALAVICV